MARKFSLLLFFISAFSIYTHAQKILVLGNIHAPFKEIFPIHSKIAYQLEDEGSWREDVIEDLDVARGWIIFQNGRVPLDEIVAVRTFPPHPKIKYMAAVLKSFGLTAGFWSVIALALQKPVTLFVGSALAYGVGWLLDRLILHKTYRLRKKYFLRLIDKDDKTPIRA